MSCVALTTLRYQVLPQPQGDMYRLLHKFRYLCYSAIPQVSKERRYTYVCNTCLGCGSIRTRVSNKFLFLPVGIY